MGVGNVEAHSEGFGDLAQQPYGYDETVSSGSPAPEWPETADIETSSARYASRFSGAVGAWFLRVQGKAVLRMLNPAPGTTVLDVGGGHGQLTGELVSSGCSVSVLSSSEACRTNIEEYINRGECEFHVGNLLDMPVEDRSYEAVVSIRLLPHLNHVEAFIREMARVARGMIIFDYSEIHSVNLLAPYLFSVKRGLEKTTRPFQSFRLPELEKLFEACGFHLSDRYPQFFLPMAFHRKLNAARVSIVLEGFFRRTGITARYGSPVIVKMERTEL